MCLWHLHWQWQHFDGQQQQQPPDPVPELWPQSQTMWMMRHHLPGPLPFPLKHLCLCPVLSASLGLSLWFLRSGFSLLLDALLSGASQSRVHSAWTQLKSCFQIVLLDSNLALQRIELRSLERERPERKRLLNVYWEKLNWSVKLSVINLEF